MRMRIRAAALAGALFLACSAGGALALDLSGAAQALAPAAGAAGGAASGAMGDVLLGKVEALKGSYSGASRGMAEGQAKILSAFGMKEEAGNARATAAKLSSGNLTAADVEAATASSAGADNAIRAALASRKKLGKDGQKQFVAGVKEFAGGLKQQAAVAMTAKGLSSDLDVAASGGGVADSPKLTAATDILSALGVQVPRSVVSARDTLSSCVQFGKAAGLALPKGLDGVLAAAGQVSP